MRYQKPVNVMTKAEMIKSFANVPGRCKMQCPYSADCQHGDYCIFKSVALTLSADNAKISELEEQKKILRGLCELQLNYTKYLEERCLDYYDMIHDYNGGVEKKLWIPPKRKYATKRRKKTVKMLRNRELMDGDPKYADPDRIVTEHVEEVIV